MLWQGLFILYVLEFPSSLEQDKLFCSFSCCFFFHFFFKKKLKILSIASLSLDFLKFSYSNPCNKAFTFDIDLLVTSAFRVHIEKTRGCTYFYFAVYP